MPVYDKGDNLFKDFIKDVTWGEVVNQKVTNSNMGGGFGLFSKLKVTSFMDSPSHMSTYVNDF